MTSNLWLLEITMTASSPKSRDCIFRAWQPAHIYSHFVVSHGYVTTICDFFFVSFQCLFPILRKKNTHWEKLICLTIVVFT